MSHGRPTHSRSEPLPPSSLSGEQSKEHTLTHAATLYAATTGSLSAASSLASTAGKRASRTLMKPLSPLRRSLSPMSSSVGNLSRSVTALTGFRTKTSRDDTEDVARPAHMAKSFMSLLTTASMYTGNLTDLVGEDLEDPPDSENSTDADDEDQDTTGEDKNTTMETQTPPSVQDDGALASSTHTAGGDSTLEASEATATIPIPPAASIRDEPIQSIQADDTGYPDTENEDQEQPDGGIGVLPPITRKKTLFELSIAKKMDGHSSTSDLQSRAHTLYEKLRSTFGINENDVFIAEYSCWLLKEVLLQGHIYLTQSHLLFLAFLPKHDKNRVSLSGHLTLDMTPPRVLPATRYWAVLKLHTLSLYSSSTELYFPLLTIDLRYAIKAELRDRHIRILTESRSYKFSADSTHSARTWVGLLKKHIFASRNKGDCVTLKIPLQNILDVEQTSIFDGAETMRIKALEGQDSFVYDDYFFMFFNCGPEAFKSLSSAIDNLTPMDTKELEDSTAHMNLDDPTMKKRTRSNTFKKIFGHSGSKASSPTLSHSGSEPMSATTSEGTALIQEPIIERYITRDVEEIPDELNSEEDSPAVSVDDDEEDNIAPIIGSPDIKSESKDFKFLPLPDLSTKMLRTGLSKWTPKMLKSATLMWTSNPVHYSEKNSIERGIEDDEFLASPEETIAATKRFQDHFSLSQTDLLVSSYYAHLHRNMPVYGKIYLGAKDICFRSLVPGIKTKMILPYKDIENCYKERGFKFGYYGLVIVIHGHEELFLEFGSSAARDDCEYLLLKQLEEHLSSASPQGSEDHLSSSGKLEAAKIRLFEDKIHSEAGFDVPVIVEEHPLLKTSLKPNKSYKFTLLTIGSRGDVQPYIALGLGLKKEGHEVTIATHAEFKNWIEGHGLRFKEIAGDPTQLMSLMVTHGSMNVGLLREASSKFRSWIAELLLTSWEACQGTEILIESPSAMAGIHIAEALGIPYFRAFTMPWTRTRAYPHAFIVPDEKRGGSYNYLTHVLFENIFWKGTSSQINKWRKEMLNLPKTNLDILQQNKVPFLYNISPTVFPPPVDFSEWVKVTGYWFLDEAPSYDPPKALIEFIAKAKHDNKKLVYIGFGSIVVSNPRELTQAVVDAVVDADVRCILNKGWSERLGGSKDVEIDLPKEVFNAGSLPHDWLFPQIDAAVHHGGSGTTGATLRAGLPTIIKPFFADQFFYANRVEDIGAGISLKKLNVKSLSKALKDATTNQRLISKAKAIGERIRQENGVNEAINVIYSELEYSRELMLSKRKIQMTQIVDEDGDDEIMPLIDDAVGMISNEDALESASEEEEDGTSAKDSDVSGSWLLV